jgi:murein DD-endopeptidase MepM/ murein hydrolase activator NlpD
VRACHPSRSQPVLWPVLALRAALRAALRPGLRIVLAVPLAIAIAMAGPVASTSSPCWAPPVDAPVTDPFRAPECTWCPGNRGIEYGPSSGQPVTSVAAGTVEFAAVVVGTRYVVVVHDDGLRATYGRLRTIDVVKGSTIEAGRRVGTTGTDFYFGLRRGDAPVDPTPYLGVRRRPARLVPTDGTPAPAPAPPRVVCGMQGPAR